MCARVIECREEVISRFPGFPGFPHTQHTDNSQTASNNNQLIFPYNSKYGKQNKMQNAHRQQAVIFCQQPTDFFFFSFFSLKCTTHDVHYYSLTNSYRTLAEMVLLLPVVYNNNKSCC